MKDYYISRNPVFARSANVKIFYSFIALIISLQSFEYFAIFMVSTGVWTMIEYLLVLNSIRRIKPMIFKPFILAPCMPRIKKISYKLDRRTSALLRGSMEGGFITTYSLYWADNIWISPVQFACSLAVIFMNTYMLGYTISKDQNKKIKPYDNSGPKNINIIKKLGYEPNETDIKNEQLLLVEKHNSVRHINNWKALSVLGSIVTYDIYYMVYSWNERELYLLAIMIILGTCWTSAHVIGRTRDVLSSRSRPLIESSIVHTTVKEKFMIYAFDIVVEIGFAYMPFYFITQYLLHP